MSDHAIGGLEVLLAAFAIGIALRSYFTTRKLPHGVQFPPGPTSLPILGSVLAIDTDAPWLTYKAWGKKYGKWTLILPATSIGNHTNRCSNRRCGLYSAVFSR
jgi:hypothetical protein